MSISEPIYLDNAATSHPKPESVYRAVIETMRNGGSPGRGSHHQSIAADRLVFATREALAELFNAKNSEGFVFTANATIAINQALFGLLQSGDRVVTTSVEHNAVARPLRALQDRGVEVVKVSADSRTGIVALSSIQQACLEKPTRLLVVNHCSNVTGSIQPVESLGRWCHEHDVVFMVDGSQSAGSIPVDFQAMQIDLFAAPGHKGLLGPQGTGFLYLREGIELTPLIYGGTGGNSYSDLPPESLPERLECGTFNLPGLAGLHAALQFLLATGVEQIRKRETKLLEQLLDGLSDIRNVDLYGPPAVAQRGAAVSFNINGRDPAEIGFLLDREKQISVRIGLHCAPDVHRTIRTYPTGTVRVSPGYLTPDVDIDCFLRAIRELSL